MIESQDLADKLWQDSRREILQALHHPFIRQLGNGSLPRYRSCNATRYLLSPFWATRNSSDEFSGNASRMSKNLMSMVCVPRVHSQGPKSCLAPEEMSAARHMLSRSYASYHSTGKPRHTCAGTPSSSTLPRTRTSWLLSLQHTSQHSGRQSRRETRMQSRSCGPYCRG